MSVGVRLKTSLSVVVVGLKVELEIAGCDSVEVLIAPVDDSNTVELASSLEAAVDRDSISVVFSASVDVTETSDNFVGISCDDVDVEVDVKSMEKSDDSVVDVE